MPTKLWWTKHRPDTLKNFIFQNTDQERQINKFISDGDIPHLLFYGVRGSGKTTLAYILINHLVEKENMSDVLVINGSLDGKIDGIRTKLINHVTSVPMGDKKIVFIDEADGLSLSAQNSLRGILEKYESNSRVIFTANYINKLTPELRSRFSEFRFSKLSASKILEYCIDILDSEGVDIENKSNIEVLKTLSKAYSHDFRQLITALQNATDDNKLCASAVDDGTLSDKLDLIDLMNKDNWIQARELVAENFSDEELVEVYRFLYDYLYEIEKFADNNKWKRGIIIISDYMYRHAIHPDQEVNFASCLIKLSEI